MSLLFLGDVAIPANFEFDFSNLDVFLKGKKPVFNLEGPFLSSIESAKPLSTYKYNLYNSAKTFKLFNDYHTVAVMLANNHINDFGSSAFEETKHILEEKNIKFFGTIESEYIFIEDDGVKYILVGNCSFLTYPGKNTKIFDPIKSIELIRRLSSEHSDHRIIASIHCGIELSSYPLPADREWCLEAIDNGAFAVINHHPHVPQGIEIYKGRVIAYSLGNFALPETFFLDKKLVYNSKDVQKHLAVEFTSENFICYSFESNEDYSSYNNIKSFPESEIIAKGLNCPFQGMTNEEYRRFF